MKKKFPTKVSKLFSKILPEDYRLKTSRINQFQHFFQLQQSDAVFAMVNVLNVSDKVLSVGVPNSALATYLRLHSEQIKQDILNNFNENLDLKIITVPENNSIDETKVKTPAEHYPKSVCDQIQTSAESIQDSSLKEALLSLSKTLR